MREVIFIKQNKEKWLDTEAFLLKNKRISADELADLYIHLLNDLSFSQTYYPKSNTTIYLNFLVSQIYQKIYKTKRIEKNRLVNFFSEDIPKSAYEHRKIIYFSFLLFFFFAAIGAISAKYDDSFVRVVLGDAYVNMTLENIKKGDPMAVYASGSTWGSAIAITINNVSVAGKAFLFGISAGILTFFIALQNAIMLGSFQYFFYEQGVFTESLRSIWLHGAMEIFSIVIATAAGFVLTKGLLFPQTFSRLYSLTIGFREALKLFMGTVPFFIAAGFIEGYVTRLSKTMPLWLNISIILGSLALITFYFIIYPFKFSEKNEFFSFVQKKRF